MKSKFLVKLSSILILFSLLGVFVFSLTQIRNLKTQYSFRDFFPKNHSLIETDQMFVKKFQLEEASQFLVSLSLKDPTHTWLEPSVFSALEQVTQSLSTVPGVQKVRSLSNIEMALQKKDSIEIGPVFRNMPPAQWAAWVKLQPLLRSQLISRDLSSTLILIEPALLPTSELRSLKSKIEIEVHKNAFLKKRIQVDVGGSPAVQAHMSAHLETEIRKFLFLSLVLFCVLMFLFYRKLSPIGLTLVGLTTANITVLGGLGWLQVPFSVLLSTLPIIVSTTYISLVLHSLHRWAELLKENQPQNWHDRQRLSLTLLKELFLANLLGSMTTAIGFLTLAFTVIPAIRNYAWTVSGAVMWTWFFCQGVIALALPFINPEPRKWNKSSATWMIPVLKASIPIVAVVIAVSIVSGSSLTRLNFSSRLFDDLPADDEVRVATEKIDQDFGGVLPLNIGIKNARKAGWTDPKDLRALDRLSNELRAIDGVGSAISVADFIPAAARKNAGTVAEQYFLYSMSTQNPLKNYVSSEGDELRIALRMNDVTSSKMAQARAQVMALTQKYFPQSQIRETGHALLTHTLNQALAKELVYGFWQSLALIGVLLSLVFGSLRWALVACLPNLVPPAILMGALAVTNTPIKPGIALVFSIALGLAFNNTVYLLTRLRRIQKESKMKTLPLKRALLMEGNPCMSESFVLFVGFLTFLLSQFQLNQTFGAFMLISILAGFVGDLFFLPAFLKEFSGFLHVRKKKAHQSKLKLVAKPLADVPKEDITRKVAGFALLFLLAAIASPSAEAKSPAPPPAKTAATPVSDGAKQLMLAAQQKLKSNTDESRVTLKIIEKNGDIKTREMNLKLSRGLKSAKALVRIISPKDVQGTALLAEIQGTTQQQWVYLPSSKQVRRISGSAGQGGILGSELSASDLNPVAIQSSQMRMLKQTQSESQIQVAIREKDSPYSQVLLTFTKATGLPSRADYYKGSTPIKSVEFLNYTVISGISRAQLIRIRNQQTKRGTDVEFRDLKINHAIKESEMTVNALKDDF